MSTAPQNLDAGLLRQERDAAPEDAYHDVVEESMTPFGQLLRQASDGSSFHLSMEWRDLSFMIDRKQILKSMTGLLESAQFTAVLGPSGSGKTTLLNVLAGRQRTTGIASMEGTISVLGEPVDVSQFKGNVAYVMQDDRLLPTDTPREAIEFSAYMRRQGTTEEHRDLTERMLQTLGLSRCANTLVGSELIKGISGGERKRTSVGIELVTAPKMLFLDEPLSGLDSYAAYTLVKVLVDLTRAGVPVLCTVHQPSSEIFAMFDTAVLLHEGQTVYNGPVKAIVDHFNRWEECPPNFNPADHVMFLLQKEAEHQGEKVLQMKSEWPQSTLHRDMMHRLEEIQRHRDALASSASGALAAVTRVLGGGRVVGPMKQLVKLTTREVRGTLRNKGVIGARLGMSTFIAGLYGWLFAGSARSGDDPSVGLNCLGTVGSSTFDYPSCSGDFQAHYGCIVSLSIANMMGAVQPVLLNFPAERPVFLREYAGQQYGVVPYFISKTLVEMPIVLLTTLITFAVTYELMGMHGNFFGLVGIAWALGVASSSLALMISCGVASGQKAIQLAPLAMLPQMLFSGLFLPVGKIPQSLRWVKYLCPLKYAINLLTIIEFHYIRSDIVDCEEKMPQIACQAMMPGNYLRETLITNQSVKWTDGLLDLIILLALFVAFRALSTLLLWRKGKYVF